MATTTIRDFENARAQAARFETNFHETARRYLTILRAGQTAPEPDRLLRTAALADKWALAKHGRVHDITFTLTAERIIEHPMLFGPEGRTRVSQERAYDMSQGIARMARTIGQHLAARDEAVADAGALCERLSRALTFAQGALAALEAAQIPGAPVAVYQDQALTRYREARYLAARGPEAQ